MNFVYTLSKLLKISDKSFINSMNSFSGLAHRYEVFLKKAIQNNDVLFKNFSLLVPTNAHTTNM